VEKLNVVQRVGKVYQCYKFLITDKTV